MKKYKKIIILTIIAVLIIAVGIYTYNNKKNIMTEKEQVQTEETNNSTVTETSNSSGVIPLSAEQVNIQKAFVNFKTLIEGEDVLAFNKYLVAVYPELKDQLSVELKPQDIEDGKQTMSTLYFMYLNGTAADFNNTDAIWIMGDNTALVRGEHNIVGPSKPVKEEYNYKFKKVSGLWYVDIQTKK